MIKSPYQNIDTQALLIDRERMLDNLRWMQEKADRWGVNLRPHTKTHKMPELAKLQMEQGACGITVAKVGEAEVMAAHGLTDIFIANEIVGGQKWRRLAKLSKEVRVLFGVDSPEAVRGIEQSLRKSGPKRWSASKSRPARTDPVWSAKRLLMPFWLPLPMHPM